MKFFPLILVASYLTGHASYGQCVNDKRMRGADSLQTERWTEMDKRGFLPPAQQQSSGVTGQIKNFVSKYRLKKTDVTIVLFDGSISTDMGYASKRPDEPYRPPCCTEYNIPSFIEEKLRWNGQQFRRYDACSENGKPVFTEVGRGTTVQYDSAWDWQMKPVTGSGYNGLTRILTGDRPALSFICPSGSRRCDFIYRTDHLSSDSLVIHEGGGRNAVEVYDEASGSWKPATGYVFSAREKDELISGSFFPGKIFGATRLRKSIYQKRLKMRRKDVQEETEITITSKDGKRLCYWGITFSPGEYMLQFINSARGGHNIGHLSYFEPWSVDYWKPDLILYSCNTINEGADVSAPVSANSPDAFSERFVVYIRKLLAKPYKPDVFAYILFTAKAHGIVNGQDIVGSTYINRYGPATVFDYIDYLNEQLQSIPVGSANAFYAYWRIAKKRAKFYHTKVFDQMFSNGGQKGASFVCDQTHLNDYGAMIGWRFLESYFNF